MSNDEGAGSGRYDLEERCAKFGESVIEFCKGVHLSVISTPLVGQLVRSGTSVGANYCEADDSSSKKSFKHCIGIRKREARESKYWLRMIVKAEPPMRDQAKPLWVEAKELHLIFSKIYRSM